MAFDITTWKDQLKTHLPGWPARMKAGGVNSAYYFIAATSLLPVLQAAHNGDWSALVSMGALLGGAVSTNLLANMVQKLKDKSDVEAANILQVEAQSAPELKAEVDALLEKLDALHAAELSLSDADKAWFAEAIQRELSQLQSGIHYQATVHGGGAIAQGNGAIALGQDAKYIVESYTENHFAAPDPRQIEKEKSAIARQKYLQKLRILVFWLFQQPIGIRAHWLGQHFQAANVELIFPPVHRKAVCAFVGFQATHHGFRLGGVLKQGHRQSHHHQVYILPARVEQAGDSAEGQGTPFG